MAWFSGYPREKINWHPTIDPEKCVKCGMCMNCGKQVFAWTEKGAMVVKPNDCVVGCTTCGNLCPGNAISFPDLDKLREVYKQNGIWAKVKHDLTEQGKLTVKQDS